MPDLSASAATAAAVVAAATVVATAAVVAAASTVATAAFTAFTTFAALSTVAAATIATISTTAISATVITALTILRETVMGPELFDKAFKEYAQRWAFKHPKPSDFFRTLEDASAVDLDWFWRGWFYTTDNVDITVDDVKWYRVKSTTVDPEKKNVSVKKGDLTASSSKGKATDFSGGPQEFTVVNTPETDYRDFRNRIDDNAIRGKLEGKNIYEVTLKNTGGLVTPVIIEWTFKDGSKEIERIPAEIWRLNEVEVKKVFVKEKEVVNIVIDPNFETADTNTGDNVFPKKAAESKFDQIKKGVKP